MKAESPPTCYHPACQSWVMHLAWLGAVVSFNILATVGLVVSTKHLFASGQFPYPTALLVLHQLTALVTTRVGVGVCGWPERPSVPTHVTLQLALPFALAVALANLSLKLNTVSVYQAMKLLNIPLTCVAEFVILRLVPGWHVGISLAVMVCGVAALTVTSLSLTVGGCVVGVVGSAATAYQQSLLKRHIAAYDLSPAQIMYLQAPMAAFSLGLVAPAIDELSPAFQDPWKVALGIPGTVLVGATCVMYLLVGLGVNTLIGATSPLTFQVVGLLKTVLTIVAGILTFRETLGGRGAVGLILAVSGLAAYSYLRLPPRPRPSATTPV